MAMRPNGAMPIRKRIRRLRSAGEGSSGLLFPQLLGSQCAIQWATSPATSISMPTASVFTGRLSAYSPGRLAACPVTDMGRITRSRKTYARMVRPAAARGERSQRKSVRAVALAYSQAEDHRQQRQLQRQEQAVPVPIGLRKTRQQRQPNRRQRPKQAARQYPGQRRKNHQRRADGINGQVRRWQRQAGAPAARR